MKYIQFLAGFLVALSMILLLVYEQQGFLRWIAAGVAIAALVYMLITFVQTTRGRNGN